MCPAPCTIIKWKSSTYSVELPVCAPGAAAAMPLRMASLRRFCSGSQVQSLTSSVRGAAENARSFSPGAFFEEKYFWEKANVGPFFLLLLFTPTMYRSCKDFYWTRQLRKLNTEEVISDRYEWLRMSMIQDEVEAELLKKVPAGGFRPLELGRSLP